MKLKIKTTAQRLQNSSKRLLSRTRRSWERNHPIPHQSSQSYHPRMMHSPRTSRLWSPARPADEAWNRRRIPQSPQITQPTQISPLALALSKSASSAQLPPPGTALTIPPILSPAGGVMKKKPQDSYGGRKTEYRACPTKTRKTGRIIIHARQFLYSFFSNFARCGPCAQSRRKFPRSRTLTKHKPQTTLALPSPICYIQFNRYPLSPPAGSAKLKFGGVYETLEDFRIYRRSVAIFRRSNSRASPRRATRRRSARHPLPGIPANHHLHQTR